MKKNILKDVFDESTKSSSSNITSVLQWKGSVKFTLTDIMMLMLKMTYND